MPQWRLILAGIVLFAAVSYHVYAISRARMDGVRTERIVWQERQLKAIAQAEEARKAAQAKINDIERDYLAKQSDGQKRLADLEAALEAERADNEKADPACPPAMSRRLRDSINGLGR